MACASGNLEFNPFLPLVGHCFLENSDLLVRGCDILQRLCEAVACLGQPEVEQAIAAEPGVSKPEQVS
jgi:fumarate hydratase class II